MYCLLNWYSPDYSNLSLAHNADGSPQLFKTKEEADEEAKLFNGKVIVVELDEHEDDCPF